MSPNRTQSALLSIVLMLAVLASPALAWEPPRGSPVRTAIIDGLRPLVEQDLGPPVLFNVSALNVEGQWAFVSVRAARPGGGAIDWSRTRFAREMAGGMMSDSILALLSGDGQRWRVVEYALGPTDVPWEEWIGKHRLARSLFEAAYASAGAPGIGTAPAQPPVPHPAPVTAARPQAAAAPLQPPAGWQTWTYGDLKFSTPPNWQSLDSATEPLKLGGDPWNATFSDRPMDTGRGVMLVFSWSDDEYIYSRGLNDSQILGHGPQQLEDFAGTRFFFQIKDRYNDFRGFDVVSTEPLKGGTFSIGCRAPAAQWPRMQDICETILASVRLASLAPAPTRQPTAPVAASPAQTQPQPAPAPAADPVTTAFRAFTTAMEKLESYETSKDHATWQAGLEAAQQAVELQPQTADYWRILGYAYALGGTEIQLASALAEEAYEKSIALDPNNTGSRMLLASLLIERTAYARALDQIEAALGTRSELATSAVVADLCRLYILDELTNRGITFLSGLTQKVPRNQSLRLGLAILLKEQNRTAEAIRLASEVAANPQAPQTDAEHAKALLKAWQG